jgi:hypothetical protein
MSYFTEDRVGLFFFTGFRTSNPQEVSNHHYQYAVRTTGLYLLVFVLIILPSEEHEVVIENVLIKESERLILLGCHILCLITKLLKPLKCRTNKVMKTPQIKCVKSKPFHNEHTNVTFWCQNIQNATKKNNFYSE